MCSLMSPGNLCQWYHVLPLLPWMHHGVCWAPPLCKPHQWLPRMQLCPTGSAGPPGMVATNHIRVRVCFSTCTSSTLTLLSTSPHYPLHTTLHPLHTTLQPLHTTLSTLPSTLSTPPPPSPHYPPPSPHHPPPLSTGVLLFFQLPSRNIPIFTLK